MPKPNRRQSVALLLAVFLVVLFRPVAADSKIDLSRFVVVGDSLAAGFQNFSLLATQQINGPANLIAQQAGIPLDLPLVPYPGIPNVLTLVSPGPPPVVAPVPGPPPAFPPRIDPTIQATNLAVPGQTLAEAISARPGATPDPFTNIVLGFPTPFLVPGPALSQMERAVALSPTFILQWIGNNDALLPAIVGNVALLTPVNIFATQYELLSQTLADTHAPIVMVNIPDVTAAPYFTSLEKLSAEVGVPADQLGLLLGMHAGDYLQPGGLPFVFAILGGQPGPLPTLCPLPLQGLPVSQVPCVLNAHDVGVIRATIQAYNQVIADNAQQQGAALVDLNALVSDLAVNGYKAGKHRLTVDFLGGFFSLDGIHPTNTGYAILANEILEQMKRQLHINITKVNVVQVANQDPLIF